jgi:hypothetical protein
MSLVGLAALSRKKRGAAVAAGKSKIVSPSPTWADIVDAADRLRHQLGISRAAWIDACQTLGR